MLICVQCIASHRDRVGSYALVILIRYSWTNCCSALLTPALFTVVSFRSQFLLSWINIAWDKCNILFPYVAVPTNTPPLFSIFLFHQKDMWVRHKLALFSCLYAIPFAFLLRLPLCSTPATFIQSRTHMNCISSFPNVNFPHVFESSVVCLCRSC